MHGRRAVVAAAVLAAATILGGCTTTSPTAAVIRVEPDPVRALPPTPALPLAQPAKVAPAATCALTERAAPHRTDFDADVWVYGDSITYQSWPQLAAADVSVDAWWGRNTAMALEHLAADVTANGAPAVVVMATGTNDILAADPMPALVQAVRDVLPAQTRVLWVNTYVDTVPDHGAALNAVVAAVPGVEVIDWHAVNVAAQTDDASPFLRDRIHVNCDGQAAWVDLVTRSI